MPGARMFPRTSFITTRRKVRPAAGWGVTAGTHSPRDSKQAVARIPGQSTPYPGLDRWCIGRFNLSAVPYRRRRA
jgi:hypothetical protein